MLENRLDKAMIKYNEAQSIRKTYEQIVKRLKEERIGFDNQLAALERTYAAKQRDYEELLLLSGDTNLKKAMAVNMFSQQSVSKERVEQRTKIDIFEAAFRKIKEATGVSDVNEVIQKIISQEGTTENLMVLTKENQAKVDALNEQKAQLKARVEALNDKKAALKA